MPDLIQFLGTSEGLVGREYIQLGGTIESGVCSFHAGGVVRGMICDRFGWWRCAAIDDERLTRGRKCVVLLWRGVVYRRARGGSYLIF